ncbi:ComEA family DNA-binding protein [Nocardia asteroides]|uniref:ComEA family DNA-binding protein n=1 Tax=Nocardia asteroides TaxID=1824 RepID=UPI001E587A60|nr:ComEA family DNA-binding protein [Nocardia asteroides]UGT60476.1 ComEA family DNA-binding protein [Nocardia asteroides]
MSRHEEHDRIRRRLNVLTPTADGPSADGPLRVPLPMNALDPAGERPAVTDPRWSDKTEQLDARRRLGRWRETDPWPADRDTEPEDDEPEQPRGSRRTRGGEPRPDGGEPRTRWGEPRAGSTDPDDPDAIGEPDWLHAQAGPLRWYERLLPARFAAARIGVTRRAAAALALIGLVAVVISGYAVWRERPVISQAAPVPAVRMAAAAPSSRGPEPARSDVAPAHESQGELVVSVVGLVHRGGLLRLAPGARIADALDAAGGTLPGADLQGLNLAQKVSDGDQILVGAADPTAPPRASGTASTGSAASASGSSPAAKGKVDLNTATEAELDALPGVGPVTARAIVAWRSSNGRFSDLEQLGDVEGIGPARLAKLRELVTL